MKRKQLPPTAELRKLFALRSDGVLIYKRRGRGSKKPGQPCGSLKPEGYIVVNIKGNFYKAHRIAWALHYGEDAFSFEIDHIDGNKSNNRIANLRLATRSQNCANKAAQGYSLKSGKYQASVCLDGSFLYLGRFDTAEEARAAYKAAKQQIFGEYAHV
jgi:hypothetical protein